MNDGYNSCEDIKNYRGYYLVAEAAVLWCGVPRGDVSTILKESTERNGSIFHHPEIECLADRCMAIHEAIDNNILRCGREDGALVAMTTTQSTRWEMPNTTEPTSPKYEKVARSRRTVTRKNLKEWIEKNFSNKEKPSFLFDEIERKAHSAITTESYNTLMTERDSLAIKLENKIAELEQVKREAIGWVDERKQHIKNFELKNSFLEKENQRLNSLNKHVQEPAFLDKTLPQYSTKLKAAVDAWEHVYETAPNTDKPKENAIEYLTQRASFYNLLDKNGKRQPNTIEDIAKIVNWKLRGGAPTKN